MGANVGVLNEVYTRINTSTGVGLQLAEVKMVRVGSIEDARKQNDFPVVNIQLLGGTEDPDSPNRRRCDLMDIEIVLVYPKLADALNTLYKVSDSSGGLYLFEKLRNVLDKNTAGAVDNTYGGTVAFDKLISYTIEDSNDIIEFKIVLRLKTASYAAGGR